MFCCGVMIQALQAVLHKPFECADIMHVVWLRLSQTGELPVQK